MVNQELKTAQANLKLSLWNIEADSVKSSDLYMKLQELGLPEEVVSRLHDLVLFTKPIAGKVYSIGKIVLLKIIEFVKAHPFMVAGAGIGAVIGASIAGLITSIPLLGPILAPVALLLGIIITGAGAVIGYRLDKQFRDVGEDIVEVAQHFFALLSDVINTVFRNIATA